MRLKSLFSISFRIIATLVMAGLLHLASSPLLVPEAQVVSWSPPEPLSPSGGYSWFPDITTDAFGNIHVAYASGYIGYDSVFYTTSNDGTSWTKPNDIFSLPQVGINSAATRPCILFDGKSKLHLTFADLTSVYYSNNSTTDAMSAQSWAPMQLMSGKQIAYFSRLVVDQDGTLHLAYTENTPSSSNAVAYHVYYRQSKDNGETWTDSVDLSKNQNGAVKPQFVVDDEKNIHLVWESGRGGGLGQLANPTSVSYSVSYDGGRTWAEPFQFPLGQDEMAKNITIGVDRNGHLVVAYWLLPQNTIQFLISEDNGHTWSEAAPIPGVWGAAPLYQSNLDTYSMANDSSGKIHLVAVGKTSEAGQSLNVLDLVWNGSDWSPPEVIATYQGDVPEWPRVAISNGNQVNVVWFVRDEAHVWDSDHGVYQVWYSKGQASAPYIPPKTAPSPTPTLEATLAEMDAQTPGAETPTPANTPEPTIHLNNVKPPDTLPLNETDYLALLAKALFPSALFVAGIVLIAVLRKR